MTTLLLLHIALMTLSLVGTVGMALAALSSVRVSPRLLRVTAGATTIGTLSGVGLLLAQPIGVKCVALATYVVVFALVYGFVSKRNQLLTVSSAS